MAHRVAPQAGAGLDDIWFYAAQESGSIEIANRLIDSITDRFFFLPASLLRTRPRWRLWRWIAEFPVGEHVIVYCVEDEDVLILRVAHGRREIEALFGH